MRRGLSAKDGGKGKGGDIRIDGSGLKEGVMRRGLGGEEWERGRHKNRW